MADEHGPLVLPLTYRADLLALVTAKLQAGECCSIVGASGAGNTTLAHFLLRTDVQAHYFEPRLPLIVLVDGALINEGDLDEFGVLKLILHSLINSAEEWGLPLSSFVHLAQGYYSRLEKEGNTHLALRYLEYLCAQLIVNYDQSVVLMFDLFEALWHKLNAYLFLNLRSLRDEYKYRLVYLTFTREQLNSSRAWKLGDLSAVEGFSELFTDIFDVTIPYG